MVKVNISDQRFAELGVRLKWGSLAALFAMLLVLAGTLGSFAPTLGLLCLITFLWAAKELKALKLFAQASPSMWLALEFIALFHFLWLGTTSYLGIRIFLSLLLLALLAMSRRSSIEELAAVWFGYLYLVVPLYALCLIAQGTEGMSLSHRRMWLACALLSPKIYDIAAYFSGRRFGKRPLCPRLSPKKTVEGVMGGIFMLAGVMILFGWVVGIASWEAMLMGGVVIALLAQFGDLFESWLKRMSGVKDSGSIPGLGGVLDMIDALLWTAPVVLWMMHGGLK